MRSGPRNGSFSTSRQNALRAAAGRASTARRKGLTIAMARRMNDVYGRAIALAASGGVSLAPLVTERFGLTSAGQAFGSAAKRQGLKVIVEPSA